jgi:7-cyano-7-deazaguanine reductase
VDKMKKWSDNTVLKSIPNPSDKGYEIKIKNPEITFLGVRKQPDYATVYITFYPKEKVIELKTLKEYFYQFRMKLLSYERLINVVYDDLMEVYDPARLRIVMEFNPRGGISSKLAIDSDWEVRGGDEQFKDWLGQEDKW